MKAPLVKDIKNRSFVFKKEEKVKVLKTLKHNSNLLQNTRKWCLKNLSTFPKQRINTRCIITGRSKAVNKTFKLSRLEFRRWAKYFKIPGIEKA